ncbi:ADP-ribosylglycohydrolase family protein (plasmid) [Rossellomorea sp. AcN35-11]|nr:ADP-ribosylglycohydrolase family protein [Rossellomorea aquimaris]WJV32018.1 ADP-ribosylglycohydrolase family protein [Rossellomorea sp. AcN35-11]
MNQIYGAHMDLMDKIKGGLHGLAIGDALGATTEFLNESQIKDFYGHVDEIIGGGIMKLAPGETTDDTAMTLELAKGIIDNPSNPILSIGDRFLEWKGTNPKDIGFIVNTVLSLFKNKSVQVLYGSDWASIAEMAHYQYLHEKSAGNGSLMRCLPVALIYSDVETIRKVSVDQSKMTHYDVRSEETCVIYNMIAYGLLDGVPLRTAIYNEIKGTIYEGDYRREPDVPHDGFVENTFRWVLYHLLNCETYEEVVVQAANKGGDSDTIAAIAGGLKGIDVGYELLPQKYKRKLLNSDELNEVCTSINNLRYQR